MAVRVVERRSDLGPGCVKTPADLACVSGSLRNLQFDDEPNLRKGLQPVQSRFQARYPHDVHYSLQVVGEDMQTHLCSNTGESLGEEVCGPHPRLQCAERVF